MQSDMPNKTPTEVLKTISADFKMRGETHESAAKKLGFKTRQSLSNILISKKYLSGHQAKKFKDAFGYNMNFLTNGEGELMTAISAQEFNNLTNDISDFGFNRIMPFEGTAEADIQMILSWIYELLVKQNNIEGLKVLLEIYHYSQARDTVRREMINYQGESYEDEFRQRLFPLQEKFIRIVNSLLNTIPERQTKEDSQ